MANETTKELQRTFSKEYTSIIKQSLKDGGLDRYMVPQYTVKDPNSCIYRLQGLEHNHAELDAGKSDFDNAVSFYEANKKIPPFIAAEEAFWAYHTPKVRRLTCPKCGRHGLCVEVYAGKEGEKHD